MADGVTVPVWVLAALAAFALIGFFDRILAPGAGWFLRRRVSVAVEKLNARLHLRIRPFAMTRRRTLVDRVVHSPQVLSAIETAAEEQGVPRQVVARNAERYAREIVPAFNPLAYFGIGATVSRWLATSAYRVRLGFGDEDRLSLIDSEAAVVFVMNHRSNMDYLLVTYMAASRAGLSYAVGEWARVRLLHSLIRAMGGFVIRRGLGNTLYRRVLACYVRMATHSGVTQAIFPEGRLTRDGALGPARLGLLGYIVREFDPRSDRDVVFVPVGLNYDRVLEDRVLLAARDDPRAVSLGRVSPAAVARYVFRLAVRRWQGRLYRNGYACVSFGVPVSLKAWCAARAARPSGLDRDEQFALVAQLGDDLMERIGAMVPVLPVSLIASVFLEAGGEPLSELALKSRAFALAQRLEGRGAYVHIPHSDRDFAVSAGLRILVLRRLVHEDSGHFRAAEEETDLLAYYANAIGHLR